MNKKMRELQAQIAQLTETAKGYMTEGEGRDLEKAEEAMDKIDSLQKELDLEGRMAERSKAAVPAEQVAEEGKASGFKAIAKMLARKPLDDKEKAMLTGESAANGENLLIPEDVRAAINEMRKTYVSAKNLVTVETTDALAGSVNYEAGVPAGLTAFDDGDAIDEDADPVFEKKTFAIKWHGKLIPISRILLGAEKAGLMAYLNRWFVKNAVITENQAIFGALVNGYGEPKVIKGWEELKKSITVDLDPSCLHDGVIIMNQSGFAALDAEKFGDGRPVLQENPADPTQKMFQGLPIHVFPDAQLPNIGENAHTIFYGSTKAGATFVEHQSLEFALSEQYLFNRNMNCLRVIEGFDVMGTDNTAYVFGVFTATE